MPTRTAKDHYVVPRPIVMTSPTLRRERLRDGLPSAVAMLKADRVDLIPQGFVDDYVALSWLEDRGAGLRVTYSGAALCMDIVARTYYDDASEW